MPPGSASERPASTIPRRPQAEVLLAVTGGIAAYKSLDVLRILQRRGHAVTVIMTPTAERFVGQASFAALSGRRVGTSLLGPSGLPGYDHLEVARPAEVMLVCPATANTLARMAAGLASDLVTSAYLACTAPVLVAPAMNTRMWEHPATRHNLEVLASRGVRVIPPGTGLLADGDVGEGRLAEPATVADAVEAALAGRARDLTGVRVLVTGGGTREPIDAVRYVGNRSSGRMAVALAAAARDRGADVTLIGANLVVPAPDGVRSIAVETAAQLKAAADAAFPSCDLLVMAAAVADYRPAEAAAGKLDKSATDRRTLELTRTEDVLTGLSTRRRPGQVLVGFAAEHGPEGLARAREKRRRKGVDLLVHNDVSQQGIGFEGEENQVTILAEAGDTMLPRASKRECAERILDAAVPLLAAAR